MIGLLGSADIHLCSFRIYNKCYIFYIPLLFQSHSKIFSAIYGVEDRIEFIVGDYFEIIQTLRPDVVFLSPPWGGPEYLDQETFDLANMSGLDGIKIFNDAAKLTKNIAYFVPRNTDGASLAKLAGEGGRKSI